MGDSEFEGDGVTDSVDIGVGKMVGVGVGFGVGKVISWFSGAVKGVVNG